jgi:WD40 repeat protein
MFWYGLNRKVLMCPTVWTLLICTAVVACDHTKRDDAGILESSQAPTTHIVWGDTVQVEELDSALVVSPRLVVDSDGFLVTEFTAKQVRRYKGNGELDWQRGREGDGPGEFKSPTAVVRMPDGRLIVSDFHSKLVTYSADAATVVSTVSVPFSRLDGMIPLDNDHLLLNASSEKGDLIHVWNTRTGAVENSFFRGMDHVTNKKFARSANFIVTARRGDTVAIAFSISDSIFFHNIDGTRVDAIRIPADSFRKIPDVLPADRINSDPDYRAAWLKSFDVISNMKWLPDGTLVVSYGAFAGGRVESAFLVHTTRSGVRLMETRTPLLLAVDDASGTLYFSAAGADVPDRWVAAKIQ